MAKSKRLGNNCNGCPLENGCRIKGNVKIPGKMKLQNNPIVGPRGSYKHKPMDYIEGNKDADIWIVGLNPKLKGKKDDTEVFVLEENQLWDRDSTDLIKDLTAGTHSYFTSFKRVSHILWEKRINNKEYIANFAHTDLVCCSTPSFPSKGGKKKIINHCKGYLVEKIKEHQPKLIIGHGIDSCVELVKSFGCSEDKMNITLQSGKRKGEFISDSKIEEYLKLMTQSKLIIDKKIIPIIFSTHLSRNGNRWADRKLGREIEATLSEIEFQEFRKSL